MLSGFVVRFRPTGPWRIGPDSGARDRVDRIYHSDSLYSAVTGAMLRFGLLEEWLDATARNPQGSAVRFSSCFPFQGDLMMVPPPATLWPPAGSGKVRWKGARFAPLTLVSRLFNGQSIPEDQWVVDGPSECALPADRSQAIRSPFRIQLRSAAAVDRVTHSALEPHETACLEFNEGAGLWAAVGFADDAAQEQWSGRVQSALRWLADAGFGGERSLGWGRSETPEFRSGRLADLLLPGSSARPSNGGYWMLSLFSPTQADSIDWGRGSYSLVTRSGRVDSPQGAGGLKKQVRMVAEGSVLVSSQAPVGSAPDVAPDGFPHPVYRAGFALAIPIPARVAS